MKGKLRTTSEAAAAAGVSRATLQEWIKRRTIAAPDVRLIEGKAVRLWTAADVNQIRRMKGRLKPGPKPGSRRAKKRGKSL